MISYSVGHSCEIFLVSLSIYQRLKKHIGTLKYTFYQTLAMSRGSAHCFVCATIQTLSLSLALLSHFLKNDEHKEILQPAFVHNCLRLTRIIHQSVQCQQLLGPNSAVHSSASACLQRRGIILKKEDNFRVRLMRKYFFYYICLVFSIWEPKEGFHIPVCYFLTFTEAHGPPGNLSV